MEIMKTLIAKNLKRLRERAKMGQSAVAEAVGVEVPTVSRWENGKMQPTPDKMKVLLKLYQATQDDLLEGLGVTIEGDDSRLIGRLETLVEQQESILSEISELPLSPKEKYLIALCRDLRDAGDDPLDMLTTLVDKRLAALRIKSKR